MKTTEIANKSCRCEHHSVSGRGGFASVVACESAAKVRIAGLYLCRKHARPYIKAAEALIEEDAYRRYRAALASPGDAPRHEDACLSIGREFLPPCALVVLDGGSATADYWNWLRSQIA